MNTFRENSGKRHESLAVEFCGIKMVNPIVAASGTFGNGPEYAGYLNLSEEVGAVSVKGLTPKARSGNAGTRIAETPSGVLNCIGLENLGAEAFVNNLLPELITYKVPLVANISGSEVDDYGYMARTLSVPGIAALEVNISCPNVKNGGIAFGTDAKVAATVTRKVKENTKLPVIVKLSPNVTDIVYIAKAVEDAGADGISLINTLIGMAVDLDARKPVLGNIYGGLSGPAIKPIALRMTHQVAKAVNIPIMAGGGIMTGRDALEFMTVGADIVSVGAATMVDPRAIGIIADEMAEYLTNHNISHVTEMIDSIHID